jgi:outer membrane receptor protein involved in Fe transport
MLGAEVTVENLTGAFDSVKSGVYWQRLEREFHRETAFYSAFSPGFAGPPSFVNPSATVTTSVVDTDDTTDTIEWQSQGTIAVDQHTIKIGLDLGYDTTELPETETQQVTGRAGVGASVEPSTTVRRVRADADQLRLGTYVQDTYKLNDWSFIPGARLDFYSVDDNQSDFDDDEFGVSGSLGTVYNLCGCEEGSANAQSLYLNLASGFRAPDLGERFQNGIVNLGAPTRIIGRSDLDPERAYTAELGTKSRSEDFSYEMAGFFTRVNDYIGLENLGISEGFATEQYNNVGDVDLYGLEIAGAYELTERLAFIANAGRTWTQENDKVDVPDWVFNYGPEFSYSVDSDLISQVRVALLARSVMSSDDKTQSARATAVTEYPSFTTLDLRAGLDLVEASYGKGSLVFGVRNLLDKAYYEPFFPQYQPERSVYVALEMEY